MVSGPGPNRVPLSVIAVAYNSVDSIKRTVLAAEAATAHLDGEVLIVDNASADGTAEAAASGERTRIVELPENVGYGPGVNEGAKRARGEVLLIINDDILLNRACVDRLVSVLASSDDIALVGARITDPTGEESPSFRHRLPGWGDEVQRVLDKLAGSDRRHRLPSPGTKQVDVGLLLAACVAVDADYFRAVGGFNQDFFLYGEDIDFCRRLADLGKRRVLVLDAVVVHDQEVSPDRRPEGRTFMQRILDARDRYYRIWLSRPSRGLLNAFRAVGLSDQPFRLRYHLGKAVWDGPSLTNLRRPQPLETIDD